MRPANFLMPPKKRKLLARLNYLKRDIDPYSGHFMKVNMDNTENSDIEEEKNINFSEVYDSSDDEIEMISIIQKTLSWNL